MSKKAKSIYTLFLNGKVIEKFEHDSELEWMKEIQKLRDKYPEDKFDYREMTMEDFCESANWRVTGFFGADVEWMECWEKDQNPNQRQEIVVIGPDDSGKPLIGLPMSESEKNELSRFTPSIIQSIANKNKKRNIEYGT